MRIFSFVHERRDRTPFTPAFKKPVMTVMRFSGEDRPRAPYGETEKGSPPLPLVWYP